MELTLEQGLQLCINRIIDPENAKHKWYDRTVKHAKLYEQLITGEEQSELLAKFFGTIDKTELKKIEDVTRPITASVCNALISAFKKVLRVQPVTKKIDFAKFEDAKLAKVNAANSTFYSNNNVDYYIEKRVHDLTFLDPNAFIVTEFESFNYKLTTAKPFPYEVLSLNAVNYKKVNGILQFLLVENCIQLKDKQGIELRIYLDNFTIVFTEVPKTATVAVAESEKYALVKQMVSLGSKTAEMPVMMVAKDKQYTIQYFNHKQGRVPAEQIGYVYDKKTGGDVYVNPIHYGAIDYLLKTIKTVAELDLTMDKHTFPQKITYVESCSFDGNGKCNDSGMRADQCTTCGKKGFRQHTSSKDILQIRLPRDTADMIDLAKLIYYAYPPIEGIKFQEEYIDRTVKKCYKAVFNSEVFSKDEVALTATGKNIDLQNVYDTLSEYATKLSDYWMKQIKMISVLVDITDCIPLLKYPKDFKMKSVTDLLNDLKIANDSSAPTFIKTEINRDIANQMFVDRPADMLRFDVKERLFPFSGKSVGEITAGVNAGWSRKIDSVLWMYFDAILSELEEESMLPNNGFDQLLEPESMAQYKKALQNGLMWFYDLPSNLQSELMYAKAEEIQAEIDAEGSLHHQ